MGGDADMDNFLKATRSNLQDLETAVIELKAKALKDKFEETFIYGDSVDTKQFDGLRKLIDTTTTTAGDSSSYSYGLDHPILEGRYRREAWETNRIQVEGYDPAGEEAVIVDTFSWSEIGRLYDKLERLEDRNIGSAAQAGERGEAYLRHAEMASVSGVVRIPPNCGQQLYDVIDITDPRVGLSSAKRRVIGITLIYRPLRGEYEERLLLGAV
jgi:hypothetical protein